MTTFILHQQLKADCIELLDLPLCKLLLANDSQYPWFILVPQVADVTDVYQLNWEQQQQFLNESSMLSEVLVTAFSADKINVAAIGNVCPQLHVHHVVRYKNDIVWPKPIWGLFPPVPYSDEEISLIKTNVLPKLLTILNR